MGIHIRIAMGEQLVLAMIVSGDFLGFRSPLSFAARISLRNEIENACGRTAAAPKDLFENSGMSKIIEVEKT